LGEGIAGRGSPIASPSLLRNMGGRRDRDKEFGTSCGSRAPIAGQVFGIGELPGGKVVLPGATILVEVNRDPRRDRNGYLVAGPDF